MKAEFDKNINMNLKIHMIFGVIMFIGLMFAILFISAGRWDYWHGWFYFLLYSYLEFFTFVIIPSELIKERYKFPPGTKKWDKVIYLFFTALGNINPLIAALDGGRYHWTGDFPFWRILHYKRSCQDIQNMLQESGIDCSHGYGRNNNKVCKIFKSSGWFKDQ